MSSILMKSLAAASLSAYAETKFAPTLFVTPSDGAPSPLFLVTPTVLLGVGFFAILHGTKVGAARRKYTQLAKEDGEPDAEERYGLPNLYVDGNSKYARAFNAVQRSHQHIMETFPTAILGGLLGAYQFPITTAISTLLYTTGRIALSMSYAKCEGDASKRYENPLGRYMWSGLLGNVVLGFLSAVTTLATAKVFAS